MGNTTIIARPDHDMLVTLNTKVDQLTVDIKDLKDDLITRVSKTEVRLDAMDVYHAGIPLADYQRLAQWTENFKANLKFIMLASGLSLGIIGGLVERLLSVWLRF